MFSFVPQHDIALLKSINHTDALKSPPQVQIHGPVSLSENVECIVVNPRHKRDSLTTKLLDRFVEQNKCNLIWMDPDDLTGVAPILSGAMGHYSSAMPLHDSLSRVRRRIRRIRSSRGKRKRPYQHFFSS